MMRSSLNRLSSHASVRAQTPGSTTAVNVAEATRPRALHSSPAGARRVARRAHHMSSVDPELPEPLRRDADAIVAAFQRARDRHEFEGEELRKVVEAFVRTSHRLELPPERMLVLLKRVVREHALDGVNAW